jgi:primosomal protein N'
MAGKNFKTGIDGLLQASTSEKKESDKEKNKTVKKIKKGIKATYYYDAIQLDKIKAIAYYDRKPIGKVIEEALEAYIQSYKDLTKAQKLKR